MAAGEEDWLQVQSEGSLAPFLTCHSWASSPSLHLAAFTASPRERPSLPSSGSVLFTNTLIFPLCGEEDVKAPGSAQPSRRGHLLSCSEPPLTCASAKARGHLPAALIHTRTSQSRVSITAHGVREADITGSWPELPGKCRHFQGFTVSKAGITMKK